MSFRQIGDAVGIKNFLFGPTEDRDITPPPSDPSSALKPPSRDSSPRAVGTGEAFGLSMVYRAISIHAVAVKQMSIKAYRGDEEVSAPAWLRRPDVNLSRAAFLEQTVVGLASTGNAYWKISRDNQGRITNLENLNPLDMTVNTNLVGKVTGYTDSSGKTYSTDDIKHLTLLKVPGKAEGLGPIQAAQVELRGAIDTRDYAGNWFHDSGVPNGVLKSDQVLSPDQAKAAKDSWNTTAGARNGVAVLGNGLTYTPVYLNPEDAQFVQNQQFNVTQIARLFGVPSSLMLAPVEGNSQTYQNVEQDWLGYVRFSLMQYLVEIEDALTSLLPGTREAKFNVEALLRSDTTTRYNSYKTAIEGGWMTIDEVRRIENLGDMPLTEEDPNAEA